MTDAWRKEQAYSEGETDKLLECWDNPYSHETQMTLYNYYQDGYSGRDYDEERNP